MPYPGESETILKEGRSYELVADDIEAENYRLEPSNKISGTLTILKFGDVNGDGTVDVADIASVITVMAGSASGSLATAADVNRDGVVDVADIATIIDTMAANARRYRHLSK